jgi:UPF0042 nucleotide-binding protein
LIIISGRSGSGKSICLRVLEDMGFYVVDNLPFILLPDLLTVLQATHKQIAVSLDSRNMPSNPIIAEEALKNLYDDKRQIDVLYLDADDDTLMKRYSETRRKHPLTSNKVTLQEAISLERKLLEPIVNRADVRIDTRNTSADDLMRLLRDRVVSREHSNLSILFESFGYKYGAPLDADYIFDIRCLPNPYWEPELRKLTGLDDPVIQFLDSHPMVKRMQDSIAHFLEQWIPEFKQNKRSYLTIALGCTGGQHRSVYLVQCLAKHFKDSHHTIQVRHRELTSSSES